MHKLEWPCRVLLFVNGLVALMGYVGYIQAYHQLVSPIIPPSTVFFIAKQTIMASFPASILLVISLCFYFFQKRVIVIITSSLAIISYYILSNFHMVFF